MRTQHPTVGPPVPQAALGRHGAQHGEVLTQRKCSMDIDISVISPRKEKKPRNVGTQRPKHNTQCPEPAARTQGDAGLQGTFSNIWGHFLLSQFGGATGF